MNRYWRSERWFCSYGLSCVSPPFVTFLAQSAVQEIGWWNIIGGNVTALAAIIAYYEIRHPRVVPRIRERWALRTEGHREPAHAGSPMRNGVPVVGLELMEAGAGRQAVRSSCHNRPADNRSGADRPGRMQRPLAKASAFRPSCQRPRTSRIE